MINLLKELWHSNNETCIQVTNTERFLDVLPADNLSERSRWLTVEHLWTFHLFLRTGDYISSPLLLWSLSSSRTKWETFLSLFSWVVIFGVRLPSNGSAAFTPRWRAEKLRLLIRETRPTAHGCRFCPVQLISLCTSCKLTPIAKISVKTVKHLEHFNVLEGCFFTVWIWQDEAIKSQSGSAFSLDGQQPLQTPP